MYDAHGVRLFHGDCRAVLPFLAAQGVKADLVLTDPPYGAKTHDGARSTSTALPGETIGKLIPFASFTDEEMHAALTLCGAVARRWVVTFLDWRFAGGLETSPPDGLRFVRLGIWHKPNGMPQYSGDRPSTGWEAVAMLHTVGGRMRWNGGGRQAVFSYCITNGLHPTQKPLPLIRELIELFSDPGDLILDPFCGSGTTLIAAKQLGRRAIGVEVNPDYCAIIARRLDTEAPLLDRLAAIEQGSLLA